MSTPSPLIPTWKKPTCWPRIGKKFVSSWRAHTHRKAQHDRFASSLWKEATNLLTKGTAHSNLKPTREGLNALSLSYGKNERLIKIWRHICLVQIDYLSGSKRCQQLLPISRNRKCGAWFSGVRESRYRERQGSR